jgi:hypothetical protein
MSCDCHLIVDKLLLTEALYIQRYQHAESTGALVVRPRAMAEPTRRLSRLIPCRCLTAAPDAPNSPLLWSRQRVIATAG